MGMKPPRSDSPGPPILSGMAAPSLLAASILAWAILTGVDLRRDHDNTVLLVQGLRQRRAELGAEGLLERAASAKVPVGYGRDLGG